MRAHRAGNYDDPVRRYFTPRCLWMHLTLLVLLPAFTLLTIWQYHRAIGGNTLSWAYTFLWPLFGVYAVYMWWQLIHDDPEDRKRAVHVGPAADHWESGPAVGWALGGPPSPDYEIETRPEIDDEEEDEELAEYNRYLAGLNDDNDPKTW